MGGYGSGRAQARDCTDDYLNLDVRWCKRQCYLWPGWFGMLHWSRQGERIASVNAEAADGQFTLQYKSLSSGDEWQDRHYPVKVEWTKCPETMMRKLSFILALLFCCALAGAQTTITLNGTVYTLKSSPIIYFDGAGGVIDTGIKYNGRNAPKAVSTNPPWPAVTAFVTYNNTYQPYNDPDNIDLYRGGQPESAMAMQCYSDNDSTNCTQALYMLNNIEQYFPFFCVDTYPDCASGDSNQYTSYTLVYYMHNWMLAYQLMQSQMTTAQKNAFADKVLNDLSAFGGISGSPGTSCTNPTTNSRVSITVASGEITAASPLFGAGEPIQVGYWIGMDGTNPGLGYAIGYQFAKVVTVIDSEHATLSARLTGAWNGYSGNLYYRRNTWQSGNCGILWYVKHEQTSPQSMSYVSGAPAYGVTAVWPGGYTALANNNNTYGVYAGYLAALLSTTANDANASVRSQVEISTLYSDFYTNLYQAYMLKRWTSYHSAGSAYGTDRPPHASMFNTILQNSLVSPPNLGGTWDQNLLYHYTVNTQPGAMAAEMEWGQNGMGQNQSAINQQALSYILPTQFLYRNTTIGKIFNWMMRNTMENCTSALCPFGNTPGTNTIWNSAFIEGNSGYSTGPAWIYALTDPTFPALDPSSSGVPTAWALNQVTGTPSYPQSVFISRTGYNSYTNTLVDFYATGEDMLPGQGDHNVPDYTTGYYCPLDYRIAKNNILLADDGAINSTYGNLYNDYDNSGSRCGYIEIGGAYYAQPDSNPLYALMPRTNTDGSNNRYAYATGDASLSYLSSVNPVRVQRHLVHFKEGQDYVVVYDDIATSTGEEKQTFLHYPNNFGASADTTRGTTRVSGNQITSSNPGNAGISGADKTQLLTQVLSPNSSAPAYVYTNNANGTYANGLGSTFRVSVCAATVANPTTCDKSNTAAEFLVVHEPVAGTGNTLPTITQPSCTGTRGNCTAVQIADASHPKVAVFARQGATLTGASFTTTHSGTAQYLIAGMTAGTYSVKLNGSQIAFVTVNANDNTLYFESTAGAVQAEASSGGNTGATTQGVTPAGVAM